MKILVASGGASSLAGFCLPFIKQFVEKGNEVVAIACDDDANTATVLKQHNVRFVPFGAGRTSINPFADAAVFVLPSDREGTPRSALEAMATGRPIVTTNSPGCRETVFFENVCRRFDPATKTFTELPTGTNPREHSDEILMGDNGFLVPTKTPEALAATLAFYIDNPEAVQVHGLESRRLAEKFYELQSVTNEICSFVGVK